MRSANCESVASHSALVLRLCDFYPAVRAAINTRHAWSIRNAIRRFPIRTDPTLARFSDLCLSSTTLSLPLSPPLTSSMLAVGLLFAGIASVSARPLTERQLAGFSNLFHPSCPEVNSAVNLFRLQAEATAFCSQYLHIPTATVTQPSATTQPVATSTAIVPATETECGLNNIRSALTLQHEHGHGYGHGHEHDRCRHGDDLSRDRHVDLDDNGRFAPQPPRAAHAAGLFPRSGDVGSLLGALRLVASAADSPGLLVPPHPDADPDGRLRRFDASDDDRCCAEHLDLHHHRYRHCVHHCPSLAPRSSSLILADNPRRDRHRDVHHCHADDPCHGYGDPEWPVQDRRLQSVLGRQRGRWRGTRTRRS